MSSHSQRSQRSKRAWSREQLLKHLEVLSSFSEDIIPNLPPSPPASRSSSPAPGSKRKVDSSLTQEHPKRPRTASQSTRPSHPPIPPSSSSTNSRYTRTTFEEGEVHEDQPLPPPPPPPPTVATTSAASPKADGSKDPVVMHTMPVRRPKQGRQQLKHFDALHDRYYSAGRQLKYSGDARFWSTYHTSHREYRALPNPPPVNSSYHKYGGLIARLELVDALICFTYALWNKDYSRRRCMVESWTTTTAFLAWCKTKWQTEDASSEGEKALLGLIFMIEGFILARKAAYSRPALDSELNLLVEQARKTVLDSIAVAEEQRANPGSKKQGTPQMLPSPASIAPSNSANSTPTNRDGDTPSRESGIAVSAPTAPAAGPTPHVRMIPNKYQKSIPPHVAEAVNSATVTISANFLCALKDQTSGATIAAFNASQQTLTLPILQRNFPKTFARMMYSTLSPTEEHEVDFEDDEGELFWPGQSTSGEGLGWVCLMGQGMLREFGKAYGYKGLKGVVPKPPPESVDSRRSVPQGGTPHGSTPSGHTPSASR